MFASLPLVRYSHRESPAHAQTTWDDESYTLQTKWEYPIALPAAPSGRDLNLSALIDRQLRVESPAGYRVIAGDLNLDFAADGSLKSLDLFTNPAQWIDREPTPWDADAQAVWLQMDFELDENALAHWPGSLDVLWNESDRRALLQLVRPKTKIRRLLLADTVAVWLIKDIYLAAIELADVRLTRGLQ